MFNMKTVAVIGVGNMGGAMVRRLLDGGYTVHVYDVDAAKTADLERFGALAHVNTAQTAIHSIATIVCVVDAEQTDQVLFGRNGLVHSAPKGHTVLLCPTISPAHVEDFAARLAALGIDCIDAPMSGGPARARDGSMSLMVACANAVFERHQALLEHLASRLFRISQKPGDGARTKLVNNLLAAINLAGAAQAMALATRLGLDAHTTLGVIEQSSGQSWIGSDRLHRALAGHTTPLAHMTLLHKDAGLALHMAAHLAAQLGGQTPMPAQTLGQAAHALFDHAVQSGWAQHDDGALYALLSA